MDFKAQVQATIDELKANSSIQMGKAKLAKPVPSYAISSVTASGFKIPDPLLEFYKSLDGFQLHWKSIDKQQSAEIFIQPFVQTFSITWKNKLWFDWMKEDGASASDAAHYRLAKSLKGFDVLDETLSGTTIIALQFPEKGSEKESDFQVIYWDTKGLKFPMSLTPTKYILEGLKWNGILDWQLFYVKWEDLDSNLWQELFLKQKHTFTPRLESVINQYQVLFPGQDLTVLNEALKEAKQKLN